MTPWVALLLLVLAQAVPASPLLGRWDLTSRSTGGLGYWIEFEDGTHVRRTAGVMIDGEWRLDGDQLTLKVVNPNGRVDTQVMKVTFAGDALTRRMHDSEHQMRRVGAATNGPAIVGVWTYAHPSGGQAFEQFAPGGRYRFRLPTQARNGTYAVEGDVVAITLGGDAPVRFRWTSTKTGLTLRPREDPGAKPAVLQRESAGVLPK